jgi:hypothetical protein
LPPDSLAYPRGQLARVTQSSSEFEHTAKSSPGLQTAHLSPTFTEGLFIGVIGFRELNVGTWLARVQRRNYTLQPEGWAAQSLASSLLLGPCLSGPVYLIPI